MEGIYNVKLKEKEIGIVRVIRKGLYYQITCSVDIPKGCYYHLYALSEKNELDLGLCIPGDQYGFTTNQPIKRFISDKYSFVLDEKKNDNRVVVLDEKPFPYLQRLQSGLFRVLEGRPSVIFPENSKED